MEEGKFYRLILKRAWEITVKFKSLWLLGLFSAMLSSGGEFEILTKIMFNPNGKNSLQELAEKFKAGLEAGFTQAGGNPWQNFYNAITASPLAMASALVILILTIAIICFVIWLAIVSQIGLIKNISSIDKNKKVTINEGIDAGVKNFWPVLIINFICKAVIFAVILLFAKEILFLVQYGIVGSALHVVSLVVFSIFIVVISFICRYQTFYIVLKKEKIMPALKSAYGLFLANWLISLEMALLMFLLYMAAAFVGGFLTSVFLAVPLVFLTYANFLPMIVITIIAAMSMIAVFAITFFITAFLGTFQWSSWTILFEQIEGNRIISKIVRLSENSPSVLQNLAKNK